MSKMNLSDWPVAHMSDFCEVVVDVTKWDTNAYSANFNFVHEYSDSGNSGFTLTSQVIGASIREIYQKVTVLINLGFFDGSNVQAHGELYDEDHNELATICWHQYADDEWDESGDDDQGLTFVDDDEKESSDETEFTLAHSAPRMIQ